MSSSTTSTAKPGTTQRTFLARPDAGAAGHIVQRADLTSRRIVVAEATLILVQEGVKQIRWSGGKCTALAGQAISLHAGEVVDISNKPGASGTYSALWICWHRELLAQFTQPGRRAGARVALHAALSDDFRASYHRAFDSLGAADSLPASIATHRLQEVLLWLREKGFSFPAPAPASLGQQVRALLLADPSAEWSMELIAESLATSVPTLRRRLADEGITFRDLVQDVRMSYALALLQNTDTPVLHIALAAGYASPSRFTARFRTRFGYLPTDIRGHNRGT